MEQFSNSDSGEPMKMQSLVAILAAFVTQFAFAETTAKDVSDTIKSYSIEKKNDAVAYGKKLLSSTDRDIKKLERKAAKASDDTKAQWQEEMKGIKEDRAA